MGDVVSLPLAFCIQDCGLNPSPSRWIFMMQKMDSGAMSYDYIACRRSLECLFGLGALIQIKSLYRFLSSEFNCLPSREKLSIKITCGDWYPPIWCCTKKRYQLPGNGCPPSKRDFHSASVIDNCMYIFGGRGLVEESDVECYPNEIMYLDTNSMMWSVPCTDAQAPCGRRSHTAVVYKGEIYIIGGFDGTKLRHLNDTFRYNPVSQEWTEMKVQGKPPFPRRRHCSVVVEDILYLFGGSSPKNDNDNDHGVFFSEVFIYPREHSDLYVLDFFPTLKRLATLKVLENNLDTNGLPSELQDEIKWIKSQPMYA
ncbi:kelch domain-containing protein 3 [Trichonephila clavipes]|nr:kelch domain-containing protein 3 [Trichonephila clavipes]